MKILRFTAENIKKLRVVEIVPDGSVVQITGPNGSGKSSVLDAIFLALKFADAKVSEPIRKGEEKAVIKLDLGDVTVIRKFHGDSTTLKVEAANGAQFTSPQKMLDELLGALAFDPLEFSRMAPREQLDTLRRLVPLDQDIDALDAANKADFDQRTAVNRRVRELTAQVDAIKVDPHLPGEPVDVSALTAEVERITQQNAESEKLRQQNQREWEAITRAEDEIKGLNHRLQAIQVEISQKRAWITEATAALPDAAAIPDHISTAEVLDRIGKAAETNKAIDLREGRKALQKQLKDAESHAQALTRAMDERTALKAATVAAAKMPVEGLGFGADGITYNGLPFWNASSAEQLRVSVAIAMAANPKLRVLRIKDGSLLDESNLALVADMATAGDYQVWVERVDSSGKVGVIMEDGEVKEVKP
jgi:DNA repair exonuclease SbcCD ATPase subunit